MKPTDTELDSSRSRRTRLFRIPKMQDWLSFRISYYYLIHLVLLIGFGWMAMGVVGVTIAFWVVLLWYSAWQRPFHPEFFVIAGLGLLAAAAMLPERVWDNVWWFVGFLIVAASPLIDFIVPIFRSR
ncbi:MAG: hypothetical protein ACK553_04410 [Planctomycetota bacterium]|jgi:hypothetical protein